MGRLHGRRTPRRAVGGSSHRQEMNLLQRQTAILIKILSGLALAIEDDGQRLNDVSQLEVGIISQLLCEPRPEGGIVFTVKSVFLVLICA